MTGPDISIILLISLLLMRGMYSSITFDSLLTIGIVTWTLHEKILIHSLIDIDIILINSSLYQSISDIKKSASGAVAYSFSRSR